MRFRPLLVCALALACALPASAGHLECHSTTTLTIGTGAAGSATIYVDDRSQAPPMPGFMGTNGTYIYAETNGKDGLQRGGQSVLVGDLSREKCTTYKGTPDEMLL